MSREAFDEVYAYSRATKNARIVLLALADCAHKDSAEAWPSVATLASRTKLGERTVQRALRTLEKLREIEPVAFGGGQRKPTRYRIVPRHGATQQTLDGLDERCQSGPAKGANPGLRTVPAGAGNGVTTGTQTREKRTTEPPPQPPASGGSAADRFWEEVKAALPDKVDEPARLYLAHVTPVSFADGTLTLRAPSDSGGWLRDRFTAVLAATATRAAKSPVVIAVPETDAERQDAAKAKRKTDRAEKRLGPNPEGAKP